MRTLILTTLFLMGCEPAPILQNPIGGIGYPERIVPGGDGENTFYWVDVNGDRVTDGPQLIMWDGGVVWSIEPEFGNVTGIPMDPRRYYKSFDCSGVRMFRATPALFVARFQTVLNRFRFRDPFAQSSCAASMHNEKGECVPLGDCANVLPLSGYIVVPSDPPDQYPGPLRPEMP
jgi:hypothetical protein